MDGSFVWCVSEDHSEVLFLNSAFERLCGRTCAEARADPEAWPEWIHPEDRECVANGFEELTEQGQAAVEFRVMRPDGEIVWNLDRASLVRRAVGDRCYISGVATDITERKQIEQELLDSQRYSRMLLEQLPIGQALCRMDGTLLDVNLA